MALSNKDPQEIKGELQAWLQTQLPEATDVTIDNLDVPKASGLSNLTILFDASWTQGGESTTEQLVARVAPEGPAVFMQYDLVKEFRVMQALAERTSVPVPHARWVEDDPSVLGAQFLVMDRATGQIPSDDPPFTVEGWVLDLSADERRRLCESSLGVLADIHRADWRALGLDFLLPEDGSDPFDADVELWKRVYDWARAGDTNATVEAGFRWLADNRPADDREPVLNWGDARVGNMMFAPDLTVNAVLDWEMVTLGSPEAEVGWWLLMMRHHTEGIGAPLPEGCLTHEEAIATYERLSGRTLENVDYYEVWAAVRLSVLMHRAGNLMIEFGLLPPDAPMKYNNPASQILARLIGAEAPTGEAQSFIGNR
jgi:aminoglycoside phosphotransferase (APT) family kinase protein